MKKIVATLCVTALAMAAFSQGTINFANNTVTKISTNSVAGGGGSGVAQASGTSFYYALLTAASTVTTVDASLQQLLTATWTFTGQYATNTGLAGRLGGGSGVPATGWAPARTNSFIVVGWSANMGATWSAVAALMTGATFNGGGWAGGGLNGSDWLGASSVAFGQAGGTDPVTGLGFQAYNLFGTASAAGTPITSGFSLFTTVPEPSTMALAGLGAAAMLIFRRRK